MKFANQLSVALVASLFAFTCVQSFSLSGTDARNHSAHDSQTQSQSQSSSDVTSSEKTSPNKARYLGSVGGYEATPASSYEAPAQQPYQQGGYGGASSYAGSVSNSYSTPTQSSYSTPAVSSYSSPTQSSYTAPVQNTYGSSYQQPSYEQPISQTYQQPNYSPPVQSNYGSSYQQPAVSNYNQSYQQPSYGGQQSYGGGQQSSYVAPTQSYSQQSYVAPVSQQSYGQQSYQQPSYGGQQSYQQPLVSNYSTPSYGGQQSYGSQQSSYVAPTQTYSQQSYVAPVSQQSYGQQSYQQPSYGGQQSYGGGQQSSYVAPTQTYSQQSYVAPVAQQSYGQQSYQQPSYGGQQSYGGGQQSSYVAPTQSYSQQSYVAPVAQQSYGQQSYQQPSYGGQQSYGGQGGYAKRSMNLQEAPGAPYSMLVDHFAAASEIKETYANASSIECPPKPTSYTCPKMLNLSKEELKKKLCEYETVLAGVMTFVPDTDKAQTRCGAFKISKQEARSEEAIVDLPEKMAVVLGKNCNLKSIMLDGSISKGQVYVLAKKAVPAGTKLIIADGVDVDLLSSQTLQKEELSALMKQCPNTKQ